MQRILLLFFLAGFYTNSFSQIITGKKVEEVQNLTLLDSSINLLITPAQTSEVKIARIDSVYYEVLLSADNRIEYVSTGDTLFKSKEGVRIGNTFGELEKKLRVKKKNIIKYPGWGSALPLRSGWVAVFDFAEPVKDDSPILFFYQRNE